MTVEAVAMPVQPLEQPKLTGIEEYVAPVIDADGGNSPDIMSTAPTWRARIGQFAGRAALVLGIAAGGSAALAVTESQPGEASSVGCYGDYCSGQYADETGCDQDARTIGEAKIHQSGPGISLEVVGIGAHWGDSPDEIGIVELRTSDNCGTVWGRINTREYSDIQTIGAQHDDGYRQERIVSRVNASGFHNTPPIYSYTPMIYARNHEVRA